MYYVHMDYKTFKGCVRKTGLELKEFAGFIGMNHKSVSNYSKRGVVPDHLALIALMMIELDRYNVDYKDLLVKLDEVESQVRKHREGVSRGNKRNEEPDMQL